MKGIGLPREVAAILNESLPTTHRISQVQVVSQLWAGYGHIYRLHITDSDSNRQIRRILKVITPPKPQNLNDEGHLRKLLSYRVESNFYRHFASNLKCHVPLSDPLHCKNLNGDTFVLLLEDLTIEYPILTERRGALSDVQVQLALRWLAQLHASHWNLETRVNTQDWCPPPLIAAAENWCGSGLWQQGGYSYLQTRMDELRNIDEHWARRGLDVDSELAYAVDWCLNNPRDRRRLGLIHGDVKAANMAFGSDGKMAMYDFQYVGKGLGVQDLAKFLTTSIREELLDDETGLLKTYHRCLMEEIRASGIEVDYSLEELRNDWELALVSWTRFQAGWSGGFWGHVEWLTAKVEHLLSDQKWTNAVIKRWREGGGRMC